MTGTKTTPQPLSTSGISWMTLMPVSPTANPTAIHSGMGARRSGWLFSCAQAHRQASPTSTTGRMTGAGL